MSAEDFAPGHLAIRKSIHRSLLAILYFEKVAPPHSFSLFAEDCMTKTYATVTKITGGREVNIAELLLLQYFSCNTFLSVYLHTVTHLGSPRKQAGAINNVAEMLITLRHGLVTDHINNT